MIDFARTETNDRSSKALGSMMALFRNSTVNLNPRTAPRPDKTFLSGKNLLDGGFPAIDSTEVSLNCQWPTSNFEAKGRRGTTSEHPTDGFPRGKKEKSHFPLFPNRSKTCSISSVSRSKVNQVASARLPL
jgi:hypothetical protein